VKIEARRVAVIPAGEKWADGSLRPCFEDWAGAGALLALLPGSRSPEAEMAVATFERFRDDLGDTLAACGSGRELGERGFEGDVALASEYGASTAVPMLVEGRFTDCKARHGF
jgi:2-phosphosulfolactate phosphatase